jgi:hypothetical protein
MNQLKVKIVGGKGVRLVDGRSPDVVVNIRLKQFDSYVSDPSASLLLLHVSTLSCQAASVT